MQHRGTGMSPNKANKSENRWKVLEAQEKYAKEFSKKSKSCKTFDCGNTVLIKNENKGSKMDKEFKDVGKIIKINGNNIYKIKMINGIIERHGSQLKLLKRGM